MEKAAEVLGALGGMAALGGLLDFYFYRDRQRIENLMRAWRARFDGVQWSNFGAKEALLAVNLLDRHLGERFWSFKRWRTVVLTSLGCLILALMLKIGTDVPYILLYSKRDETVGFFDGHQESLLHFKLRYFITDDAHGMTIAVVTILITTIAFNLSISITRFMANIVVGKNPVGIRGFAFFVALLLVHGFLLLYWSKLLHDVSTILGVCAVAVTVPSHIHLTGGLFSLERYLQNTAPHMIYRDLTTPPAGMLENLLWYTKPNTGLRLGSSGPAVHKLLLDFISNGLRIAFALAYLGSFIFGRSLQPTISRIWEGLVESKKPFFTTLFGGIGALYGGLHVLMK